MIVEHRERFVANIETINCGRHGPCSLRLMCQIMVPLYSWMSVHLHLADWHNLRVVGDIIETSLDLASTHYWSTNLAI
jgi:hypothetical protein